MSATGSVSQATIGGEWAGKSGLNRARHVPGRENDRGRVRPRLQMSHRQEDPIEDLRLLMGRRLKPIVGSDAGKYRAGPPKRIAEGAFDWIVVLHFAWVFYIYHR